VKPVRPVHKPISAIGGNREAAMQAAIGAAPGKGTMKWEEPRSSSEVRRSLNTMIREDVLDKMDHLATALSTSKRALVEEALEEYANRRLLELGIKP
jgi:hypothetical protein